MPHQVLLPQPELLSNRSYKPFPPVPLSVMKLPDELLSTAMPQPEGGLEVPLSETVLKSSWFETGFFSGGVAEVQVVALGGLLGPVVEQPR